MNLEDVNRKAGSFFRQFLNVKDYKIIRVSKVSEGWEADAEVFEESAFIKSLGIPAHTRDRNIYVVLFDDNLNILSYERKEFAQR